MPLNSNPGFGFLDVSPHASEGEGAPVLSVVDRFPMPMPQPFQHGTVVYGQSSGYTSYPPEFRPTYGNWQNNGEPSPGGDFGAQQQAQYFPPEHPSGEVTDRRFTPGQHGLTSPPAPFSTSPLPLESELAPYTPDASAPRTGPSDPQESTGTPNPLNGDSSETGFEVRELNAEDIKPNVYHFSHLSNAVQELETCKTIFEQCDDKLVNDLMLVFHKESLEFKIQSKTDELKVASSAAVTTARDIHNAYQSFAQMIVDKLRVVSQSDGGGTLFPDEYLNSLWRRIDELSLSIKASTETLRNCIYDLTRLITQTRDKYERRHLRKKLWEWLVRFFEAIARALGAVHHGIMAGLGRAGLVGAAVGANGRSLVAAARAVCSDTEKFKSKQEQGFQHVLGFLENELPKSLKKAEMSLTNFNAFREVQELELVDKKESLSGKMTAGEAKRALRDWEALCRIRA